MLFACQSIPAAGLMPVAVGPGGQQPWDPFPGKARLLLPLQDRLGCFSLAQASTCSGSEQFGSFADALFGIFIKNGSYLA